MHGHKWEWWAFSPLLPKHNVHLSKGCGECATALLLWRFSSFIRPRHRQRVVIVVVGLAAVVGGTCPQEWLWTATISRAKTWNGYSWTHGSHSWKLLQITGKDFQGVQNVLYWYSGIELIQSLTNLGWALFLGLEMLQWTKQRFLFLWNLHKVLGGWRW